MIRFSFIWSQLMEAIYVANALELKRALNAIPDEQLEGVGICVDEGDLDHEDGVEIEFEAGGHKWMTIVGNHI